MNYRQIYQKKRGTPTENCTNFDEEDKSRAVVPPGSAYAGTPHEGSTMSCLLE